MTKEIKELNRSEMEAIFETLGEPNQADCLIIDWENFEPQEFDLVEFLKAGYCYYGTSDPFQVFMTREQFDKFFG